MTASCCAGVALAGDLADTFAATTATPLTRAELALVPSIDLTDGARVLWETDARDETTGIQQHQALMRDGSRWTLVLDGVAAVEADVGAGTVRAASQPPDVVAQLLAAVAFPVLAHAAGAHVLHGSAAADDGVATAVVGPGGAGKSTLLRAAVDADWEPLTEDVCVLDPPPSDPPRVWPGPPWLRLARSIELPPPWKPRFTTTDKTAWDLRDRLAPEPRPLGRIVLLEVAGGDRPEWEQLERPDALARLVPHVTWLGPPEERAADAFAVAVRLSRDVEVRRLRLPRGDDWVHAAIELLGA